VLGSKSTEFRVPVYFKESMNKFVVLRLIEKILLTMIISDDIASPLSSNGF
jgi:hypothetical protein